MSTIEICKHLDISIFMIPLIIRVLGCNFLLLITGGTVNVILCFLGSWILSNFLIWSGIYSILGSCICSFQVIVYLWDTLSSSIFYKEHEIDDINTLAVFHPCQMYPIVFSFPNFMMSTSFPSNILECNDESSHLCSRVQF